MSHRYSTASPAGCPKCGGYILGRHCPSCLWSADAAAAAYWAWFREAAERLADEKSCQDCAELLYGMKWLSGVFPTGSNFIGLADSQDIAEMAKGLPDYNRFWLPRNNSKKCSRDLMSESRSRRMLVTPAVGRSMNRPGLLVYDGYTFIKLYRQERDFALVSGLEAEVETLFVLDRVYASAALQSKAAEAGYGKLATAVPSNWRGYRPNPFGALAGVKVGSVVVCSRHGTCSGGYAIPAGRHYRARGFLKGHDWDKYDLERLLNLHPSEVVEVDNPKEEVFCVKPESRQNVKGGQTQSRRWKSKYF